MRSRFVAFALAASLAVFGAACSSGAGKAYVVDTFVMSTAYRPPPPPASPVGPRRYELLAGDLHCHVSPPDPAWHVTRDLADTVELSRKEKLDFVVLTPHLWARFYLDEGLRAQAVSWQKMLRAEIAAEAPDGLLVIPGFEYTDGAYGHAGMAFADLEHVLAEVPLDESRSHPERFFERWVEDGGLLVVNHPLLRPIASSFAMAREDLSWRPFFSEGPFPPDIAAIDRLATGFEVYNLSVTEMRDRHLLGDRDRTLLESVHRLDVEIEKRGRRMTPVGGSDSHSHHLRATTFVLATGRSPEAIRDGLAAGRVCVRSPGACSLEARPPRGDWVGVGERLGATDELELRAQGRDIEMIVDGEVVARPEAGQVARVGVEKGACHVVRARVGEGFSAPIYVGCWF